jgi:hypothetical protein
MDLHHHGTMILLFKESIQADYDEKKQRAVRSPVWILDGQFPSEDLAKERARLLAKAAPDGQSTGRYGITKIPDEPKEVFKASVPAEPTVSLRKVKP